MNKYSKYVGMDVHKETIVVAIAKAGRGEAMQYGEIDNNAEAIRKLAKKQSGQGEQVLFCYEAGPCGYGIYRQLNELGHDCLVVAPSLIPRKAGDRIKTDRRDAVTLARLCRAGELTAVWVPDKEQEAVRDLTRAREDMKTMQSRLEAIEQQMYALLESWSMKEVVVALMALRGVKLVSAMTILAELGDISRFKSPRQLMAYLGLVPSEYSSGQKQKRGSITKSGNGRH